MFPPITSSDGPVSMSKESGRGKKQVGLDSSPKVYRCPDFITIKEDGEETNKSK